MLKLSISDHSLCRHINNVKRNKATPYTGEILTVNNKMTIGDLSNTTGKIENASAILDVAFDALQDTSAHILQNASLCTLKEE